MSDVTVNETSSVSRRNVLRVGAAGAAAFGMGVGKLVVEPSLQNRGLLSPNGVFGAASIAFSDALYTEVFPTSPLILTPFMDRLLIPQAAKPVSKAEWSNWPDPPQKAKQNSLTGNNAQEHQCWPTDIPTLPNVLPQLTASEPIVYKFDLLVRPHYLTTSKVLPINSSGLPTQSYGGAGGKTVYPAGTVRDLPPSTIYGFNGTFPGPRINAEYGKPVIVRFDNQLDKNPLNLDRQDFGSPDYSFLTHLHNGHTAPESDGNPHYSMRMGPKDHGYAPGMWCDNLYLNWPAGGDDREKQSFFWFHDHRMDQTGSNVYKGMVGLYPIYDPKLDPGDENAGLGLPGVRTNHADGSFDVEYDIPLALYDCRLDDGVTTHHDMHDQEFAQAPNNIQNPKTHPEWWGKTFYKHFPNHGFVGDIFTVNGTAYPTLEVKRRTYRFRFLDCSLARIYELKLMSSSQGPKAAKDLGYSGDELQGQYRIPDGQQCMKFMEIADDGGLLPTPILRDSFELWPAKRREFVVDFSKYQDGTPTKKGDVIYLTDVMKMPTGRMWSNSSRFSPDPKYKVPMMKIVIAEDAAATDNSTKLVSGVTKLRDLPPLPSNWKNLMNDRLIFEVERGSGGGELEWLINGVPFNPATSATSMKNPAGHTPLAAQKKGSFNLWEIRNGGGGWVHPFHLHMEEHRVVMRNGKDVSANVDPGHPDDKSREDLIALDPSESVIVYRGFRDFTGYYVAHCHNLAHEDHAMMFGWEIDE